VWFGLALVVALASGHSSAQPLPAEFAPTPVEAQAATVEPIVQSVHAIGTLRANQAIVVRPEIAGVVNQIPARDSVRVARGDVLFRLDDSLYRAELSQAEASLSLSESNYKRAVDLLAKQAGTAVARDQTLSKLEVDRATVALAKARLDKATIRAPFAGVTGFAKVDVGAFVMVGQELVSLDEIDPIRIDFEVPERFARFVAAGQTVRIEADALPGEKFEGKIDAVSPRVDPDARTIGIRARVPNGDERLRPGLFVRIAVIVDRRPDAVVIPEQAILPRGDRLFVYRVVDGKAVLTPIVIGLRVFGRAEIIEGLKPGETVITAGQQKVQADGPVTVLPPKGQAGG
jgi:membrane fusion protein (multidrug efflux system)